MDIDLELVVEGYALGVPLETLMPKPKSKQTKKRKPRNGNPMHRRLPGDKVGQFIVVRDTGKTDKKSKSAIYELKCVHCGRIREMDLHYASKLHSCGCLTKQRQVEGGRKPREEEADCRLLREMHHIYCNPEQTLFTNVRRPGKLALYADMSDRDREMLAETLAAQKPPTDMPWKDWTKLNATENLLKGQFLQFLDIYQHDQIAFPSRDVIVRADKAVELWLRMKTGTRFEDIAKAFGTDVKKVVRTLYAVSLRLQITAFVEAKYGKHALWNCPFTEDKWGTWEQVEASHHCLYDSMVKQGDQRLADYWKKKVNETLDMLERRAKLIGI